MGDSEKKDGKSAEKGNKKGNKPAVKKQSWFKGLKGQFKSISWPSAESVGKQTGVVVIISAVLGLLITIIDVVFRFGLEFLVK